jgi:hypothetical protein
VNITAWVIIGGLSVLVLIMAVVAWKAMMFGTGLISAIIKGMGGPDLTGKQKR